jgi:hypothetical protein
MGGELAHLFGETMITVEGVVTLNTVFECPFAGKIYTPGARSIGETTGYVVLGNSRKVWEQMLLGDRTLCVIISSSYGPG